MAKQALAESTASGPVLLAAMSALSDRAHDVITRLRATVFAPGGRAHDFVVRHGDVVWVARQPRVFIYGEVQRPGVIRLERGMTVMQVLATGGGLNLR